MREAYAGVISSLKQQLMNATRTTEFAPTSDKQLPVDQSLNQLSVSEIFRILLVVTIDHPNKNESFNDRELDKSLEKALNVSVDPPKEGLSPVPLPEEESEASSEDYESELEEIYTAYSNQFIRDESYGLFETQLSATKGINIGKFGRF